MTYRRTRANGGGEILAAFLGIRGISKQKCEFFENELIFLVKTLVDYCLKGLNHYVILIHFVLILGFS